MLIGQKYDVEVVSRAVVEQKSNKVMYWSAFLKMVGGLRPETDDSIFVPVTESATTVQTVRSLQTQLRVVAGKAGLRVLLRPDARAGVKGVRCWRLAGGPLPPILRVVPKVKEPPTKYGQPDVDMKQESVVVRGKNSAAEPLKW